ncbi:MAG: hypothetical protein SVU32_03330 [Candidatus Nanohaloarchaea archaeon]|nr:hypothetical protein [Candidatus Nanohaloarchaea archaeon]
MLERLKPRFREVAEAMEELVAEGEVASCSPNDYWIGDGPTDNLGYDPDTDEIVVIDVGELHDRSWEGLPLRFDTGEEFLSYHGI